MKKQMIHQMIGCLFAALVIVGFQGWSPIRVFAAEVDPVVTDESLIPEGVYIGETHVGGMTIGAAKEQLKEKEEEIRKAVFTITQGEHVLEIPVEELGIMFQDTTELLYDAATVGQTGMLVERYKELKDLSNDKVVCTWSYAIDSSKFEEKVAAFAEVVFVEPVDAMINRENHQWFREPHVDGVELDKEATLEVLKTAAETWDGSSVSVEAVVNVIEPKYTEEMLSSITEIIGSHVTIMSGLVEEGRGKNVVRGAELINGTILMPGESFSAHAALTPFTEENGYDKAIAYHNGGYVDSIGGGVCQLTTTLYNAILYAELQVDRRYNHSMIIGYAEHGFDSTVNDDASKDLVFTNNYDFPIYIEARAWGETEDFGQVYFAIWGTLTEEKKARTVVLYNEIVELELADTKYIIDTSLEPGEEEVKQASYPKLVVKAFKKVIVDGEVVSDEYLYTDSYRRSDGIVHHNPIEESTEEDSSSDESEDTSEESTESPSDEMEESTQSGSEISTEESTQSATESPTEESTQAATESPTEESTQAATESPTEESTQAATESPTEESTQAVSESPTEESTQESGESSGSDAVEGDGEPEAA